MLSLLYCDDNHGGSPAVENLSDLMLGKILSAVTPNIQIQRAVEDIIVRPLRSREQIEYRREILEDFSKNRVPVEKLRELTAGFDRIHSDYKNKKSSLFRLFKGKADYPSMSAHAAEAVKGLIDLIYSLNALFRDCHPESAGLCQIKSRLQELAEANETMELYSLANQFSSYYPNESSIEAEFGVDSDGKISRLSMISASAYQPKHKTEKKRGFCLFGRSSANESPSSIRAGLTPEDCDGIISKTTKEIAEAFEYIINSVCGEFSGIYQDSAFYVFSVKYCEALKKAGVPVCFAELADSTEVTNLYDTYLLLTIPNPFAVVPNDFALTRETRGIIITGDNSAGKTVYLRAVAMAYIFTAAGLPIPAETAKISLPKSISLEMASAERAYQSGDITGRFEEEVIDLKKIVDSAEDGSLILLNEVFQTTDYSEGAQGLYYILEHFGKIGAKWILVTHLRQLVGMYKKDSGIVKLSVGSAGRYKVSNAQPESGGGECR